MELWNRVLAFDPQNAEVMAALDRLQGRRRLRRASLALAAAAVVMAGGWKLAQQMRAVSSTEAFAPAAALMVPPPPAPPSISVSDGRGRHAGGGCSGAAGACRAARPPGARARGPRPPAAPGGPSAPAIRTFTLGPTPQNVDVYLDGQRQFAYDPTHTTIAIPWNANHLLELRSPSGCCFVERVDIGPITRCRPTPSSPGG